MVIGLLGWRDYWCVVCEQEINTRQNWHHGSEGQMHWRCELECMTVRRDTGQYQNDVVYALVRGRLLDKKTKKKKRRDV